MSHVPTRISTKGLIMTRSLLLLQLVEPHIIDSDYYAYIDPVCRVVVTHWAGDSLIIMDVREGLDIEYSDMWQGIKEKPHHYMFNLGDPELENKVGKLVRECQKDHIAWMKA